MFLSNKDSISLGASFDKCSLYSTAALFLAAKMREIDIKTPFASEIPKLEGNHWKPEDLRKAEVVISNYFGWNLCFTTAYDVLKELLYFGTICMTDYAKQNQTTVSSYNKFSISKRSTADTSPYDSPDARANRSMFSDF